MKIKVTEKSLEEVRKIKPEKHKKPVRQSAFWRFLMKTLSKPELKAVDFEYYEEGMERLNGKEPALYLMIHSSFTDLQIAATLLADRQFHIVCTNDGLVGKEGLMRAIGCIPAKKFILDVALVRDMKYAFEELKSSILMYPEASYSFDGSETPLPDSIGKFIKVMKVPVVVITTEGAFLRDPLYNNLQKRKTKVTAKMKYVLSPEEIGKLSPAAINDIISAEFVYDHFRAQSEGKIKVDENFRADGLERVLYKCPVCGSEAHMLGKGIHISCQSCGLKLELTEYGELERKDEVDITKQSADITVEKYVTDWYSWERECVKKEIEAGEYRMEADVDIYMLVDMNSIYKVGDGHLTHTAEGFKLTGCDGELEYVQKGHVNYSLYSDYFWYEIGDMVSIGDANVQYYCFPKENTPVNVAKTRLATEEIYKYSRNVMEQ